MNFIDTTIFGYIFVASLIILILSRDLFHHRTLAQKIKRKIKKESKKFWSFLTHRHYPFHKKEFIIHIIIGILTVGIALALYVRFIEVDWLKTTHVKYDLAEVSEPVKIIWLSDLQVGTHKKEGWVKKIIKEIERENPDAIILGGDIIDNEGTFIDETTYLEPFAETFKKYPTYYILGNHEYGIGGSIKEDNTARTANRVPEVKAKMTDLGAILLENQLSCPTLKNQQICLFGGDEIWASDLDFSELSQWNQANSIIFLTHNPDGILSWPNNYPLPDLTLAGHTHGGQIWIPFYGPLGSAEIKLGKKYYRGAQKYNSADIYISVGAGESGGTIRFFARPELTVITLN